MQNSIAPIKTANQTKYQWINAREYLPDPNTTVAVLTKGGSMETLAIIESNTHAKYLDGIWTVSWFMPNRTKGRNLHHHLNEITHWMPLPPSPLQLVESKE